MDGDWIIWGIVFVSLGGPVLALTLDRAVGISGRLILFTYGLITVLALTAVALYGAVDGNDVGELVLWGVAAGLAGTLALDIVRLVGVHLKLFPMDMPRMFGAIALGIAPRLQQNIMAQLVDRVSRLDAEGRLVEMRPRLEAASRMGERRRKGVMSAMMYGLSRLPEERRRAMLETQMGVLASFPSDRRRAMMATMDALMMNPGPSANGFSGFVDSIYRPPPHGMPRIPMATFREIAEAAFPITLEQTGTPKWLLLLVGYTWHFLIGTTFGVAYTLVFGEGSWPLAMAWGVFVWAAMMVLMPPMMPLIRFPKWFPIWPLLAHLAMAAPIGILALEFITDNTDKASVLGSI